MSRDMDARVRRATRSICEGCVGGKSAPRTRYGSAEPRPDAEPVPSDPAQAPIE
jgi:hypothetical protein